MKNLLYLCSRYSKIPIYEKTLSPIFIRLDGCYRHGGARRFVGVSEQTVSAVDATLSRGAEELPRPLHLCRRRVAVDV